MLRRSPHHPTLLKGGPCPGSGRRWQAQCGLSRAETGYADRAEQESLQGREARSSPQGQEVPPALQEPGHGGRAAVRQVVVEQTGKFQGRGGMETGHSGQRPPKPAPSGRPRTPPSPSLPWAEPRRGHGLGWGWGHGPQCPLPRLTPTSAAAHSEGRAR